jgi:TM2 domain-containing membrane protein YozV
MKNKVMAALLSLFLGVFGVQFFYLGRTGMGIAMLFLTIGAKLPGLAFFIGFVNFLVLLFMSDENFDAKYNTKKWNDTRRRREEERQEQDRRRQQKQYEQHQYEQERQQAQRNQEARARMNPTPPQYKPREKMNVGQKETFKQAGLKKYKEFDYYGAIEDFGKALAIDPSDVAVHWNLACLYSLCEQKELAFYHLQKSVELGFRDYDKVKTHEALSFLRVQPEFEAFSKNGLKMTDDMEHSDILQQLKDLSIRREQGLLSEKEFALETRRLID